MARIAGVDVADGKQVMIGLRRIYGLGPALVDRIVAQADVNPDTRVKDLTEGELARLREIIRDEYVVEGDLRKALADSTRRLMDIGCYRGVRTQRRLPVRGQRTRTNARTKRGGRQTIAGRGKRRGLGKK